MTIAPSIRRMHAPFTPQERIIIALVIALHGLFFVSLEKGLDVKSDPTENEVRVMANLISPETQQSPPATPPPPPQQKTKPEAKPQPKSELKPAPLKSDPSTPETTSANAPEASKSAESQLPNAAVAPAAAQGGVSGTPIQTDIGKLVVVYQPDADPYYPSFSKRAGEQGEVVVRLIIDESGVVEDVALLRSSGFPRLDRAASEIGRRYRFKPYSVNGAPARISTNLLIKFNLKN